MLRYGSGQMYIKIIKIEDLNMINNSGTLKWKYIYIYILEEATKTGKYPSIFVIFFFFFAYTAQKEIEAKPASIQEEALVAHTNLRGIPRDSSQL